MAEDVHEFTGNLTRNPEIRYTSGGKAVTTFTIANTPRRLVNGSWQDGTTLFLRVTCWDNLAENVAASIQQGNAVKVTGTLGKGKDWTDKNGQQRQGELEINASDVQVSLRNQKLQGAPVKSYKNNTEGGNGGNRGGYQAPAQAPATDDEVPF